MKARSKRHLALAAALLSLAACSAQDDTAGAGARPVEVVPAADAPTGGAPVAVAAPAAAPAAATPAEDATPSFDCAEAQGEIELMVCGDPELARLDRQLAGRWAQFKAVGATPSAVAEERGWIEGRDGCWKADDKTACVREAYLTRLVELAIKSGQAVAPSPVEYRCDDDTKPFTVLFYNDIDPKAAVITWGNDQAIAFPVQAASGAHYGRTHLDFWEHQGEAKVDFYGNKLTCKPAS